MKSTHIISVIFILSIFISCADKTENAKDSNVKETVVIKQDSPAVVKSLPATQVMDTIFAGERDTAFNITHGSIYIIGLSKPSSPRKYTVHAKAGQEITGTIRPLKKNGNVRISQLQFPDKSFDGPFGDSAHYRMPSTGNLSFIIGQNMMAGDPWKGEFVLFISVKE